MSNKALSVIEKTDFIKKHNGIGWKLKYKDQTYGYWLNFEEEVEGWFDVGYSCPVPISDKDMSRLITKMMVKLVEFLQEHIPEDAD